MWEPTLNYVFKLPARWEVRHPSPAVRNDKQTRLVGHRFPIKGGLTFRDVRNQFPEHAEVIRARTNTTD